MPRGNGTGPIGQNQGRGQGRGSGRGLCGKTGGRPEGFCVCPNCGEKTPHQKGTPCRSVKCPKCNTLMTRE